MAASREAAAAIARTEAMAAATGALQRKMSDQYVRLRGACAGAASPPPPSIPPSPPHSPPTPYHHVITCG